MSPLNNHVILSHIDSPVRILFWPASQFFACTIPLAIGMTIDHLIIGLVMSLLVIIFFKVFNKTFGKVRFRAITYWYLPTPSRMVKLGVPPSHIRVWYR